MFIVQPLNLGMISNIFIPLNFGVSVAFVVIFKEMFLLTTTEHEARSTLKNNDDGLVVLCEKLKAISNFNNVILKLGADGILICSEDNESKQTIVDRIPALNNNMTLVSTATTAQAVPTKGDMVMTYTNGAGTAVINTNIKGYVSRDGGTTYTQGTLASQGTTGGHTILTFHDLDISGQPSGSSMRYKIETLVQSASMDTRIQAVSLGWS